MYVMKDGMGRRVKGDGGTKESVERVVGEAYSQGVKGTCWRSLLSRDGGNLLEEPIVEGWRELVGGAYCQGVEGI